jgi:phosphopantothenate-cysteine ligase
MNILITAGGNTEKIDEVRVIRNTGTGRLGALVAEKLAAHDREHKRDGSYCAADGDPGEADGNRRIFYLCDKRAVTPRAAGVTVIHADNVTALGEAVREVCATRRIDAVIHSMAVSDYRVKNVTTVQKAKAAATIVGAPDIREGGKISSDLDDVLVLLERAPKIISLFRKLAPDAVIVGFKLLSGVSEEELIRVGFELLGKNDCDYVLANDMKYLRGGGHVGHLIARDGSYQTYDGKEAIAEAIAEAVLQSAP